MSHSRHFLTVGELQLHFRFAGSGAPLVLFHACPKSSAEQVPLLERLAKHFSVYAFDLPGYGDSDPLPIGQPEIADFADHISLALDALGIEQCSMYGRHTGGLLALEFGHRHKGRLNSAIFDGFPIFSEAERRRFLSGYLQPLIAMWDGLHLPGLWARIRENYLYFPWNEGPVPENRNPIAMPTPEQLHRTAIDMLKVMDQWRIGYASAFRYRPYEALAKVPYRAMIMARRDDLLYPHLERLGDLPETVAVEAHTFDVEAWARRIEEFFEETISGPASTPPPETVPRKTPWSTIRASQGAELRMRKAGSGRPSVLVLHDVPGSTKLEENLVRGLSDRRAVVAPDLPGIGLSTHSNTAGLMARLIDLAQEDMDDDFAIIARGLSAPVALQLAQMTAKVARVALIRPRFVDGDKPDFISSYAPPIAPDPEGTYLTRLWYACRDNELYWPWYRRELSAVRFGERRLDPAWLNGKVVAAAENLDGYRALVREIGSINTPSLSNALALILSDSDSLGRAQAQEAARLLGPAASILETVDTDNAELETLRRWLEV